MAKRITVLLGLCTVIVSGIFLVRQKSQAVVSPIPEHSQPNNPLTFLFTRKKNHEELQKKITEIVGDTWKNYSVLVKDYTSDFTMGINDTEMFTAASVNKVPILAGLYYQAQKGDVDLDRVITLQSEDIQDYGTGTIRYDPVGTTYSIKTLARLMMQKSDNTAAYIINVHILGEDVMQSLINTWGLTQTNIWDNKTSNADMAILFEKMIHEKITNHALTQEMLGFMKGSDFEDRIPAGLPSSATAYHKIGNGIGDIHDVGIVVDGNTKYYIGILTADITDETGATALSAKISKTVYDFMH